MKVVRRYLHLSGADIGMTGANVGIAQTGAIVIETNEGNARLVSRFRTCTCIMGREKVVETVEDALQTMMAHPLNAVGQSLTTYVTLMAGRSPLGQDGKPRQSHLIILDNGRTRMRNDPLFWDALNCIRCAACMNICPTYGVVGGHAFGYIYPGPIGIPWTAQVHGLEKAGDFAPLCISWGCARKLSGGVPLMIAAVKDCDAETHRQPLVNRVMMAAEPFAKFASATAPVSNWMLRNLVPRWRWNSWGSTGAGTLPPFSRPTLARIPGPSRALHGSPPRAVCFSPTCSPPPTHRALGLRDSSVLEALGARWSCHAQLGCGYQYLAYGDLKGGPAGWRSKMFSHWRRTWTRGTTWWPSSPRQPTACGSAIRSPRPPA